MISPEQADTVIAPPGTLLVERESLEKSYAGLLYLGRDYVKYTIGATAFIRSVGAGVSGWSKGDKVLLSATIGKPIEFGMFAERTLWKIYPSAIIAHLDVETEGKHLGAHPARGLSDAQLSGEIEQVVMEGDSRGLR